MTIATAIKPVILYHRLSAQDLNKLEYRWPSIVRGDFVAEFPTQHPVGFPLLPKKFPRMDDIYLVIMYNWEVDNYIPELLQEMYEPIFGRVRPYPLSWLLKR
jgi:hypothetical protein